MLGVEEIRQRLAAERRVFVLTGEINQEKVGDLRKGLLALVLESERPITLFIDTDGGECEASLCLVDFLRLLTAPVYGLVIGRCRSMGVSVLQGCHKRLATPHSRFFLHPSRHIFQFIYGEDETAVFARLRAHLDQSAKIQKTVWNLISARSGQSVARIRELCEKGERDNLDLNAQEALELGLIDDLVPDLATLKQLLEAR